MSLNPASWPPAGKLAAVFVVAAAVAAGAAVIASQGVGKPALAAASATADSPAPVTGGPEPGVITFVCQGTIDDTLLQWRQSSDYLSGTYEFAQLSGQAPQEQVSASSGNLSGTLDGTAITLDIGLSQPLYGTLSGGQLTLNVPQQDGTIQAGNCAQASLSQWNGAVASLNSQASGDNQAANQAQAQASHDQSVSQAQQSLAHDVSSLKNDSDTLNNDNSLAGDIKSMQTDYATEQSDYRTEQSDSCDSMGGDASTVGGDASTVSGDLSTLNGDISSLQSSGVQGIKNDLANVQSDLSTLQSLGASPDTSPSSAIAAGNQALKNAASAISWAQGKGNEINGQAQQLATTAQNYVSQHCG